MLLLIDNFDSFTYNIVHAFQLLGQEVHVLRNHVKDIGGLKPDLLVIGPGPGNPANTGISKACLQLDIPTLGICLGHQLIGEMFGCQTARAKRPMHGKACQILHSNKGLFRDLPQGFMAARYHSLILNSVKTADQLLEITAWTADNEIMGIRHKYLPIEGVQFHPESIASEYGLELLQNFISQKSFAPLSISRL